MAGWIDFGRDMRKERIALQRMTESQSHRGPDAAGAWIEQHAGLVHRRLAVIDLEGGKQPMVHVEADEQAVCLVFTGEVYNFPEVRLDLEGRGHTFHTRSDTETVLRGYLEWGADVVERLNGMFAFAIWDARKQELLLVRDRLGIKPLFYYRLPHGVVFGSEPKALFASGMVESVLDAEGLCELLSLVRTPGVTVFRGMKEVKPGNMVRVNRLGLSERCYWKLEAYNHTDDFAATVDTVRGLLDDIVRL